LKSGSYIERILPGINGCLPPQWRAARANIGKQYQTAEPGVNVGVNTISGRSETQVYFSLLSGP